MKSKALTCIVAMTLFGALAITLQLAAQEQQQKKEHTRYKLIDLGTFGGPASYFSGGGIGNLVLNNRGIAAGYADTSAPDPYAPNCFNADCFLSHTFRWHDGVLTDLGALPGANSSAASGINARGWIAGYSENGVIDPLTGFPETNAVLWKDGQIINLGTLGGNESLAISVKCDT
jgi:probable HAF family extracellular repeat protein